MHCCSITLWESGPRPGAQDALFSMPLLPLTASPCALPAAKKQLLAVTPESSPAAAPKRKTAEQRQWEAWSSPPTSLAQ